ncbi:MAG: UvrD-helicase domain-containing protein [Patescibacteria group bacterium]
MIDFSSELNQEQLAVVYGGDGPCLVLAGAGSGKTRVITYRVAYLLANGVSPENILLVTFTNKAADEMSSRVQKLTGSDQKLPWSGTFHHIAYKILRIYAPLLGYKENFTVLDSDDSESLIKLCAKPLKTENTKFPSAKIIGSIISYARNCEKNIEEVIGLRYEQWFPYTDVIKNIAGDYYKKKKEANAMDFDDLLTNFLLLLNSERVWQKYAGQFKYILVDEYQDTNKIQAEIIKKLAGVHKNILVVGDDAQSIYSFRAADIQNILQFEKDYPNAKIFKLETNYRSSQEILDLANGVIANNLRQYKKKLKTLSQSGLKPALHPQMDAESEAQFIVQKISESIDQGLPEKEIAVLFRAAHHSQMLEMELVKAGIPYDYRGGLRFFERAHIKDVLAYLRVMNNLADTAAWMRILMKEEGIGPSATAKLVEYIKKIADVDEIKNIGSEILGERAKQGWYNFTRIWEAMLETPKHPVKLIETIMSSPYKDYLEAEYIDSKDRIEDIEQLKIFANKYKDLEEFLAESSLQEGFNKNALGKFSKNQDKIVLSTIHQAKGLEWAEVFLINLSGGAFPNDRALREAGGLEEERRLFYVAITRAKKHLFLTYPMAGGGWGDSSSSPSLFLSEISADLLEDHSLLSDSSTVLNDDSEDVHYFTEDDKPFRIKPGSFLRSVEDL